MVRKIAIIGTVVAVGFATLGVGSAHAAAKVNAAGSLHCPISGKIKISPALVFGGTSPGGSTFSAKISGTCTGTSGVTSLKGKLVAHLPTNDCTALALVAFPSSTLTKAKYKGGAKYNPSTPSFSSGGSFTFTDPITLSVPGAGTSSVASGSFVGQSPTVFLRFDQSAATLATNCTPKTKGLKGSGGLKKMSFSGPSSFDIS